MLLLLGGALLGLLVYHLYLSSYREQNRYNPVPLEAPSSVMNRQSKAPVSLGFSYYPVDEETLESKLSPKPFMAPLYDIPLDAELQEYTYSLCQEYNVDYELVLAIMERESRFMVGIRDNVNENGTRDRGLMQINQSNWKWLSAQGLDVNIPEDNIEAGVMVISDYVAKYGETNALIAYQCGEARMRELVEQGYITQYATEVLGSRNFPLVSPEQAKSRETEALA
ncbi:transglycosylase SLT domain-containing protein [Oscillospiraceae bacterium MB08-C2-2]|nr:transglycosylase SLT domain-containing protein [Oscillospiraceae bacterium MB08-C2-2]